MTRAAVCRAVGAPLSLEEVGIRAPQGREVSVDVAACAICHSDLAFVDDEWATALPAVFGHEAAGTVAAVGADVRAVAPGERVVVTLIRACGHCAACGDGHPVLCASQAPMPPPISAADGGAIGQGMETGAFAERVLVDESQVVSLPPAMPFDLAALLGCGALTGYGAVVNTAQVPSGAAVAVIGAGGVGLSCIQAAAMAGAEPVFAIDPVAAKRALALEHGATHALDPGADDVPAEITALTAARGVDFAFVAVGIAAVMERALALLGRGGTLVVVGMPPDGAIVGFDPSLLAARSQRILGSKMGGANPRVDIPAMIAQWRAGRLALDAMVSGRFPFTRINEALDAARAGGGLRQVVTFDR